MAEVSCEIELAIIDDKSTLILEMACCFQAASH